jgi:hypothetical protein
MASVLKVDKLDPQSGTALEIGTSGDTITVPSGATLDISASTLTPPATMPASSGVNLTALNATQLTSGTVPTARLGSGTASSSTVLYGDQTYKAEPGGGKLLQCVNTVKIDTFSSNSMAGGAYVDITGMSVDITPASADNHILIFVTLNGSRDDTINSDYSTSIGFRVLRDTTAINVGTTVGSRSVSTSYYANPTSDVRNAVCLSFQGGDNPNTTSQITYQVQLTQAVNIGSGTGTIRVNANADDPDNYSGMRMASSITAMEIEGSI